MMNDKMNPKNHELSLEAGDWIARQFFSPLDLQMPPEEYAARFAHLWGCFSLDRYRFEDAVLAAWIHRLAQVLSSQDEVERCRDRFLTPDERAQVQKEQNQAL